MSRKPSVQSMRRSLGLISSASEDLPPPLPAKPPSFDAASGEETFKFVVHASRDACFSALCDTRSVLRAVRPGADFTLVSGSEGEPGAVFSASPRGGGEVRAEMRTAAAGKLVVYTVDETASDGATVRSLVRWELRAFRGDEGLCQVTRVVSGRTMEADRRARAAALGVCGACLAGQARAGAQEAFTAEIDRVKAVLTDQAAPADDL